MLRIEDENNLLDSLLPSYQYKWICQWWALSGAILWCASYTGYMSGCVNSILKIFCSVTFLILLISFTHWLLVDSEMFDLLQTLSSKAVLGKDLVFHRLLILVVEMSLCAFKPKYFMPVCSWFVWSRVSTGGYEYCANQGPPTPVNSNHAFKQWSQWRISCRASSNPQPCSKDKLVALE